MSKGGRGGRLRAGRQKITHKIGAAINYRGRDPQPPQRKKKKRKKSNA